MDKSLPSFSVLAESLVIGGTYEHYKGLRYKIIGVAHHSESLEEMVVYQALYGKNDIWVRPLAMFLDDITFEGRSLPRFRFVNAGCSGLEVCKIV
jgi:hypothetical protein